MQNYRYIFDRTLLFNFETSTNKERYAKLNKKLHLRHLSPDCRQLLSDADEVIDVNIMEDPSYRVALD